MKQTMVPVNAVEYHRAVEICHMRRLMRYNQEAFEEDWKLAQALALLMALGKMHFEPMLDSCFQRILAYTSNEPDAAWRLFIEPGPPPERESAHE